MTQFFFFHTNPTFYCEILLTLQISFLSSPTKVYCHEQEEGGEKISLKFPQHDFHY